MRVRVASAGTGKTTSLVLRYLELIASGMPLRRIAGVTFTRSAADELRQRVALAIQELLVNGTYLSYGLTSEDLSKFEEAQRELDGATLTTIHGFMIESLRLVAPLMGLDPNFSVLDEWEAKALFEEELTSLLYLADSPNHGLYAAKIALGQQAAALVLEVFSQRSLSEVIKTDDDPINQAVHKLFEAAYRRFEVRLAASLLPPSEVERRALKLVRNPAALKRLADRFKIILVDEFQDVNPLQGAYFEALERSGMLTEVVGDPKQSIYGFRQADIGVFRRALAQGEQLDPLIHTRRHARRVCDFLNHMTATLAQHQLGFSQDEAPKVEVAGRQQDKQGHIELHWINGDDRLDALRKQEARVLAQRLKHWHQEGMPYREMAVLARAYAGLSMVEEALQQANLPYVLLQGRGYYERIEVRDLYHALRTGIEPVGLSLAAFLRGPFAQLELDDLDTILKADQPLLQLQSRHPEVYERLELIQQQVRGTPLSALKFLIREPLIDGQRYVDFLDARARENVDALLFTVAEQPPGDIERLLDRLQQLSLQADAGDVPQSGEGIQLLTVHKAKGLEWPLVAIFDSGRKLADRAKAIYLHEGFIVHQESQAYNAVSNAFRQRNEQESFRLLYVAASRARDILIMTGSCKNLKAEGWLASLELMKLGPGSKPYSRSDFVLQTHTYEPQTPSLSFNPQASVLQPALWIDQVFKHKPHPPVSSPSRVKQEIPYEPLPFSDPDEGERLPGRATTVGTLVHYAISQNWRSDNPEHLENLKAQEVMFPFTPHEQEDILSEVKSLLANYESLLGQGLPDLWQRSQDYAELPMAIPYGSTVWQGIIDRLYCINGQWVLEDYKTDHELMPERYFFQLAVYVACVTAVKGIKPTVQLVFLRDKVIVPVSDDHVQAALESAKDVI